MENEFEFLNLAPSKVFVLFISEKENAFLKSGRFYEVVNWCERLETYLIKDMATGKVSWQPMALFMRTEKTQ
jgi:hypothetical protein